MGGASDDRYANLTPRKIVTAISLTGFDIGRGTGSTDDEGKKFVVSTNSIKIWHVKEYSYTVLPEADYGHFYSSEGWLN